MVKVKSISGFLFIFLVMVSLFFSSCILPVYFPRDSKGLINTSDIKPGVTTKEDLFLEFGNAFLKNSDDEKLFTATVFDQKQFGLIGFLPYCCIFPIYERKMGGLYEIDVEFDDNDVVKRCEEFKLPRHLSQEKSSALKR
jgi:hypothetical protein